MIEVVKIEDASAPEPRVEVRSALGQFSARWSGATPPVGASRAVELGLGERLTWGVDIVPVEPRAHAIGPGEGDGVVLWASVEQLDDGGYVGLRLGPSIVMTNAEGDPAPVGATVRVEVPVVTLFDSDI